jgi:hypothetical protein
LTCGRCVPQRPHSGPRAAPTKKTKGKKERAIKLPNFAVDALRKHRAEQAKLRL